jgi:hypothetical protein
MSSLPEISSYGEYSSDNYGVNSLCVDLGTIRLYYSYKTIVAFYTHKTGLVVSGNVWTVTTGKHLNWIRSNKKDRLPYDEFEKQLQAALDEHIV